MQQLKLQFPVKPCLHPNLFVTMACVPAGVVCTCCGKLLYQYLPKSPDVLGYVSADWALKYKYGNEWTTLPRNQNNMKIG